MGLLVVVGFTLLGSICSVTFAGLLLVFEEKRLLNVAGVLIPFAIGTLLGAAFFGMIPHALDSLSSSAVLPTVLLGSILFYVLEKFAVWRHCHEQECEVHSRAGAMILIGDSIHNLVDGVAIAAAFAGSFPLGITTSAAVIAHEVPQEVSDFAILLKSGYSRTRALLFNGLSSLAALIGAVVTYFLLPFVESLVPYLVSVSAASFIYVALADLVPGRRVTGGLRSLAWELPLIGSGIALVAAVQFSVGH
jgi:zinc and cadmium transporter